MVAQPKIQNTEGECADTCVQERNLQLVGTLPGMNKDDGLGSCTTIGYTEFARKEEKTPEGC